MEKESPAARASADRGIKSGERGLNTKNLAQREARHARVTPAAIEDKRLGHAAFRVHCCLLTINGGATPRNGGRP
jgi:hypothetical protein